MKDMHSGMTAIMVLGAALLAADNTPVAIDLQGFNSAELIVNVGIGGVTFDATDKIEFVLTHSDDDSTYTNVADVDMLGVTGITDGIIKSLTSEQAAATVSRFGYKGGKRYLKFLANFSGTHGTGTPIAATILKGKPNDSPQPDQA